MKRSGRFYRKNESEVMKQLGFQPTPNSGSGWIFKEDGQTEHTIAQLKSSDAESIRVGLSDIHKLEENAIISHKNPVFVIQFLKTNDVFILVRPTEEILGVIHKPISYSPVELYGNENINPLTLQSDATGRQQFNQGRELNYKQKAEDYKSKQKELNLKLGKKKEGNNPWK